MSVKTGETFTKLTVEGSGEFDKAIDRAEQRLKRLAKVARFVGVSMLYSSGRSRILKKSFETISAAAAKTAAAILKTSAVIQSGFKKISSAARTASSIVSQAGRTMVMAGTLMAAPLVKSLMIYRDFSDTMLVVKAKTGATAEEFSRLEKEAKRLGATTSFSAVQVGGLMAELGAAGFRTDAILNSTESILALAKATKVDLPTAAAIAAASMGQFKKSAADIPNIADVITYTVNSSAQGIEEFGEAMKNVGPIAKGAGETFESTSALLALLSKAAIKGGLAGTHLKIAISNLSKEAVQNKLKELGVSAVDSMGNLRRLSDVIADVADKTETLGSAKRLNILDEIFGRGKVSAGALTTMVEELDNFEKKLGSVKGAAKAASDEMDSGIGGAWNRFKSAMEGVFIVIGEKLAPIISKLADTISKFAGRFEAWLNKNPKAIESFALLAVKIVAIGGALLALSPLLATAGSLIGSLGVIATGILSTMTTVFLSGIPGAIAVAIGSLTAFNMDFESIFDSIQETASKAMNTLGSIWGDGFKNIKRAIDAGSIKLAVKAVGDILVETFETAVATVKTVFKNLWTEINRGFDLVFDKLIELTTRIVSLGMMDIDVSGITNSAAESEKETNRKQSFRSVEKAKQKREEEFEKELEKIERINKRAAEFDKITDKAEKQREEFFKGLDKAAKAAKALAREERIRIKLLEQSNRLQKEAEIQANKMQYEVAALEEAARKRHEQGLKEMKESPSVEEILANADGLKSLDKVTFSAFAASQFGVAGSRENKIPAEQLAEQKTTNARLSEIKDILAEQKKFEVF